MVLLHRHQHLHNAYGQLPDQLKQIDVVTIKGKCPFVSDMPATCLFCENKAYFEQTCPNGF